MRKNKKLIIIISIVLILAIAGAAFAYLYLMTDIFKSNEELFAKYFVQNTEILQKITDFQSVEAYENLKNENKYESNTNIKMVHSVGGEVSNPLNNLAVKLDIQKDDSEQYIYADGQILYEDEEYLEAEIIKEENIYGIRFTDVLKQFITVKEDEDIESLADDIGITGTQLGTLINVIGGSEEIITEEQVLSLKDKYLNIMTKQIIEGTFEKQKNAKITYNNTTVTLNAYSVLLSSEQVENMLIEILNNVKTETEIIEKLQLINKEDFINKIEKTINWISKDTEIPAIKITVFEQNQTTIRTDIEIDVHKISIENTEQNGEIKTNINYLNNKEQTEYNLELSKKNFDNQENIEVVINVLEGEESHSINLSSQIQLSDSKIALNTEIGHKQDITTISMKLDNETNIGRDFEKTETLIEGNNALLSSIPEQRRSELINSIILAKVNNRIDLIKEKIGLKDDENGMSEVDVNKFNSKFQFYEGDEVSAENVKTLLDIVKNNMSGYEFINSEAEENTDSVISENNKVSIKLNIEKDKTDEEGINKILEKIDANKKYTVSINYKETNGLIEYINIVEI